VILFADKLLHVANETGVMSCYSLNYW